jgi:hypothetical protein
VIGCGKDDEPAPAKDSSQTVVEDSSSNEGAQPPANQSDLTEGQEGQLGQPQGGETKVLGAVGNALWKAFSKTSPEPPNAAAPPSGEPRSP